MVRGVGITVTKVPGRYQWAEIESTARGRRMCLPMVAQPSVQALCDKAFIGLPCPKKMAGIGFAIFKTPHFEVAVMFSHHVRLLYQHFDFHFSSEPA
jgi:hypothetical protein